MRIRSRLGIGRWRARSKEVAGAAAARDPRTQAILPDPPGEVSRGDLHRAATMVGHLARTNHSPASAVAHAESLLVSLAVNEIDEGDPSGGEAQRLLTALDAFRDRQHPAHDAVP